MSIQLPPERPPVYGSEAHGCQIKALLMLHLFMYTAYEQFHRGGWERGGADRGPETMTLERFLLTLPFSLCLSRSLHLCISDPLNDEYSLRSRPGSGGRGVSQKEGREGRRRWWWVTNY